ncbi:GxxExxY protein [Pseudarcicella hirudinis]|uniref:GxxExxY protein n=1 Tax=Pseudarcicella hirudinis TaxID=1079859 RepID=A0A1I5XC71_9BACT|nr:GxxExxY protein [Pseudarcicella hirudinis]SFQ29570.1 GxxExxY protein [Pseudarcicella hirudinis]
MITQKYLDELTYNILGCAIEVHRELGPGLLEKVYEKCLIQELYVKKLRFEYQQSVPVIYKNEIVDCDLRYDLLVENSIVIELKSVEKMLPLFDAQLMTYMKLLKMPKGILINFNVSNIFKEGQRTFVNEHFAALKRE